MGSRHHLMSLGLGDGPVQAFTLPSKGGLQTVGSKSSSSSKSSTPSRTRSSSGHYSTIIEPPSCTLSVLSTDPSPMAFVRFRSTASPVDSGDYCVLKTDSWRQAVSLATVSNVQACDVYSLFTTYNVQTTVDGKCICLDM